MPALRGPNAASRLSPWPVGVVPSRRVEGAGAIEELQHIRVRRLDLAQRRDPFRAATIAGRQRAQLFDRLAHRRQP